MVAAFSRWNFNSLLFFSQCHEQVVCSLQARRESVLDSISTLLPQTALGPLRTPGHRLSNKRTDGCAVARVWIVPPRSPYQSLPPRVVLSAGRGTLKRWGPHRVWWDPSTALPLPSLGVPATGQGVQLFLLLLPCCTGPHPRPQTDLGQEPAKLCKSNLFPS